MRAGLAVGIVLCCAIQVSLAQGSERILSLHLRGSYTTSSKIFLNPDAQSLEARNQHIAIEGLPGGGIEVQYRLPRQNYFLALSADFISKTETQHQLVAFSHPPRRLPVEEGFQLIPIELGVYAYIPLGSDQFRVTMGGGLGAYVAHRTLSIAGVEARPDGNPVAYGIHVESAAEYRLVPRVWLRGALRFRDPEVTVMNRFEDDAIVIDGTVFTFTRSEFKSRINANGMNFSLGVVVELF